MPLSDFKVRVPGTYVILSADAANKGTGEITTATPPPAGPTGPTGPTGPIGPTGPAGSGSSSSATVLEIDNVTVNGSEYTPGATTLVHLYVPTTGDTQTINVQALFVSVTTDWGQKYTATLASIDQINEAVTTYGTTGTLTAASQQVALQGQVLQSSGQGQIVALQFTNLVTSGFTCDIQLIYDLSPALTVPTLPGIVEPAPYTGARLATAHVGPTQTFAEMRWIFSNQVTFNVIANIGDTTMTIRDGSGNAINLPSGWMNGMVLVAQSPPTPATNSVYVTAGVTNPYATQVIPPWPPGMSGTTLTAGSITLSHSVTNAYSGVVTAYWVGVQDGGTIQIDAGDQYEPCDIPPVFASPITIQGTKSGSTLATIMDGRGGFGSGAAFRLSFGKGFIHTRTPCTIKNIAFKNCGGADNDGDGEAAIYVEAFWLTGTATVQNCSFDNNENGLFAPQNANISVVLTGCDFGFDKPNGASNDGFSHDFYLNCQNVTVTNCFFYGSIANCLKSRSPNLTINNCYISHLGDRALDYPEGGTLAISNTIITSQNRGALDVVANYIGYGNELSVVPTINTSSNVTILDSWITTNRFDDEWWIAPAITVTLQDCMLQYCDSQGDTPAVFEIDTSVNPLGTIVWSYNSVNQVVFPANGFIPTIPIITPLSRAFNLSAITSVTLDSTAVALNMPAGTVIGNFVFSPSVASLGGGTAQATILNNPAFNTNTSTAGYFQIVSSLADGGIALATNIDDVPGGTYALNFLILAPYSAPTVEAVTVIAGKVGAIIENGSASDSVNEHNSTFKGAVLETGTASDSPNSSHTTMGAISETGTASDSTDSFDTKPLIMATQPTTAETSSFITGTLAFAGSPSTTITGTWSGSGGTPTISNAKIVGNFVTFNATTPSSAGTYTLALTATSKSVTSSPMVIAAAVADFTTGITGPSSMMLGQDVFGPSNSAPVTLGNFIVRGAQQPVKWSLTGTDAALFTITNSGILQCFQINSGSTTRSITVNATDTVTNWTKAVTVHNPVTGTPLLSITANVVLDSAPINPFATGTAVLAAITTLWNCSTLTFSDPSSKFSYEAGLGIILPTSHLSDYGTYPITITPAGGSAFVYNFYIAHETKPQIGWTPAGTVYNTTPVTDGYGSNLIGTVAATADSSVTKLLYTSNPTGAFNTYVNDPWFNRTGLTYLLDQVSGSFSGTCEATSANGQARDYLMTLPVAPGIQYPSTNISGTPASNLTNFLPTANIYNPTGSPTTVLTITVSGFTPNWSLAQLDVLDDNCQLTKDTVGDTYVPRYAISGTGTTGTITAWNLSAINETTPQVDQLQITLTDGAGGYCTRTFPISTSWIPYTGSPVTVGPGGTFADPSSAIEACWTSPSTYAGATFTLLRGCPNTFIGGYGPSFTTALWMPCPIHWCGDKSTQKSFTGSISNGSGSAGTILNTSISSGLFVGDWIATGAATGTIILSAIDSTHWNVSVSQLVAGGTAMTSQIPQIPFNFNWGGGDNQGKGALHCAGGYDTIWERVEAYNARNGGAFPNIAGNCGAFYKEGVQPGNCTLIDCYAHDSDMGWRSGTFGDNIYLINSLFATCGGNDLNHNIYVGEAASVTMTGCYSVDSLGHGFKSRALNTTATSNFFLEGMNWWGQDSTIQNAEGGPMTFSNNVVLKGPDVSRAGENGDMVEYANETQNSNPPSFYNWYPNNFEANNNTFMDSASSYQFGTAAINMLGGNSDPVRQTPYVGTIINNSFYNMPDDTTWSIGTFSATAFPLGSGNATTTTMPTGLSIVNPITGGRPFNLPTHIYNIGSAPGNYDMVMTVLSTQASGAIPGGLLASYDDQNNQLTSISASITGGDTTGFSITASGNTAQLNVTAVHTPGVYFPQVTITGTAAGNKPTAKYFTVFVLAAPPKTAAISETGSGATDTCNGTKVTVVTGAISETGSGATDTVNASVTVPAALVAHVDFASGTAGGTTTSINTTGATLLVANITSANVGGGPSLAAIASAFTDSKSNTWTAIDGGSPGGIGNVLVYCLSPTVGTSHTFSCSVTGLFGAFFVAAFSGVTTLDQSQIGFAPGVTTLQADNPITPTNNGSLLVTGMVMADTSTPTINDSFTITDAVATLGGNYGGGGLAYFLQGTPSSINPTWSWTTAANASVILVSFNT